MQRRSRRFRPGSRKGVPAKYSNTRETLPCIASTGSMQADARVGIGRVQMRRSQPALALPLLEEADRFWRDFDPDNPGAGEAALWLGRAYRALGREVEATGQR